MKPRGRKRIRRGGKSKRKKETSREHNKSCVLFYTNMNGFKSKADSLKQLIIKHNVDVLVLTETKVYSKSKIRLDGYKVFPAVRKRNGGGRMLVAIKHSLCSPVMIDEGENAEFITICLDFGGVHFRLICIYSPQENDSIDPLDGVYKAISSQITRACLASALCF